MRRLVWNKHYAKHLKRLLRQNPNLINKIESTLSILIESPFDPRLNTHKLKGGLKECWSCSVEYNLRIVFQFVPTDKEEEDDILLLGIGDHDTVY